MSHFYATSPNHNFIKALADYLLHLGKDDPLTLAHSKVYLPSRRACLKLTQALATYKKQFIFPKMYALNDFESIAFDHYFFLDTRFHKEILTHTQQIHLIHVIVKRAYPTLGISQILTLSEELLEVINELRRENITREDLMNAYPALFHEHYSKNLALLNILIEYYQNFLDESQTSDSLDEKKLIYTLLPSYWKAHPFERIILGGISQYQKDSVALLRAALTLDHVTVILPFVDAGMLTQNPPPTSPHYQVKKIIDKLKRPLRPLPFKAEQSPKKIYSLVSETPFLQSKAIALAVAKEVSDGAHDIALVIPDRSLARQVILDIQRLGLPTNDSSAISIHQSNGGLFLILASKLLAERRVQDYFSFFKYSLRYESPSLYEELFHDEVILRSAPITSSSIDGISSDTFKMPVPKPTYGLAAYINTLQAFILSHSTQFFESVEGLKIQALFEMLSPLASSYPDLSPVECHTLILHHLKKLTLPPLPPRPTELNINIIGLMEARVEVADIIFVTNLEEGILPRSPNPDAWLSPSLREKLGLDTREELVGLQAQDFFQTLQGAPKVILCYCKTANGLQQLPSRFWYQVESSPYPHASGIFKALETHKYEKQGPDHPPSISGGYLQPPTINASHKPKKLSLSAVKLLMEDSYGFYAKYVLKLRPLWVFDDDHHALIFGQALHEALDRFIKEGGTFSHSDLAQLQRVIEKTYSKIPLTPMVKERLAGFSSWICSYPTLEEVGTEVTFEKILQVEEHTFTLYGRADRIDKAGNLLKIIDYKTGTPPSLKMIQKGYAPQLPLEGFLIQDALHTLDINLHHIHILPKPPFAADLPVKEDKKLIELAETAIHSIFSTYIDNSFHFYPRPNPYNQPERSDYTHLERQC